MVAASQPRRTFLAAARASSQPDAYSSNRERWPTPPLTVCLYPLCFSFVLSQVRDSRLTFLLQDYFQGNSKTLMFVNISPASMHAGETLCSLQFAVRARQVKLNPSAGGASLDGWSSKYKGMLQAQQLTFATREKKYAATFKEQKAALKVKDTKIEAMAAQLKALTEQLAEAHRNFERAESDRLRAVAATLPGGSTKDRRLEASEDKKWAALQSDLSSAQSKAAEAKQSLERVQNEWKDKYAALEARHREAQEKLRVQRLELAAGPASRQKGAFGSEPEATATEENPAATEVAQLNRQVALLELEVKRLRIANRQTTAAASAASAASGGSSSLLRSPTQRPRAASISTVGTSREPLAVHVPHHASTPGVDSAAEETPGADDEASASPAAVRSPRAPVARPAVSAASSTAAPSSLTSAKLAALQAQKRAQEAQSKPRSLLVGPRPIGASSSGSNLHSRTASQDSIGTSGASNGNGLAALSESGPHNDLSSLKIDAGRKSDDGSETSDTASVASLAASVTSTSTAPSAIARPRRSGLVPPPTHSASAAAAVAAARVKLNAAKLAAAASGTATTPTSRSGLVPPKPAVARVSLASGLRAPTAASAVAASSATAASTASVAPKSGLVKPKPVGVETAATNGVAKPAAAPVAARSMLRPPTSTGIPPPKAK